MPSVEDRIVGCVVGGAVGDALGAPFEGTPASSARELLSTGQITDDTQLTLATCEAVLAAGGVDPETIAQHFALWFRRGRVTHLGASTLKALRDLAAGAHWALAGATGEFSAGAGAAMRVAPLAFALQPSIADDRRILKDVCRITHRNDNAWAGALAVVVAVQLTSSSELRGSRLLAKVAEQLPDSVVRDRIDALARELPDTVEGLAQACGATGFVGDAVPLSLGIAASQESRLEDLLTAIVRVGGDTDTVGAIVGSLVGARGGIAAVPHHLTCRLASFETIACLASDYAIFVERLQN